MKSLKRIGDCFLLLWLQSSSITTASKPWNQVFVSNYDLTFYDEYAANWGSARRFCQNIGADLVMLKETSVINAVKDTIGSAIKVDIFWLGAYGKGHHWTWVDHTTVDESLFTWGENEPGHSENRIFISKKDNKVGDALAKYAEAGTICQRTRKSLLLIRRGIYRFSFYLFSSSGSSYARSNSDARALCKFVSLRLVNFTDLNDDIIKGIVNENDPYWVNTGSGCTVLVGNQVVDKNCDEKHFPLCEAAQAHSVTLSQSSLKVTDNSATEVKCSAYGYPTPYVSWRSANGRNVSDISSTTVYQTRISGGSTLYLKNAKASDEGQYTCYSSNTVSNTIYSEEEKCQITVPSKPIIDSITPNSCNTSLAIAWRPHHRAVGMEHRIRLQDKFHNISNRFAVPANNEIQNYITGKLMYPSSEYIVKIQLCSVNYCYPYVTTNVSYTGGIPEKVTAPTLRKQSGTCQVNWQMPLQTPKSNIEGYQINITSTSAQESVASSFKSHDKFVTSTVLTYAIPKLPNRNYSVSIKAKTCAGFGLSSSAEGLCATDTAAPSHVAKPESNGVISEDGKFQFDIRVPDESNGIISCIFVIVQRADVAEMPSIGRIKNYLGTLAGSDDSNYIAIAKSLRSMETVASKLSFTLGTELKTECNTRENTRFTRTSTSQSLYKGENKKLNNAHSYLIRIVTSTPSNSGIEFQISEPFKVEPESESSVWIPATAASLVVLLLIVLVFIYVINRRRQSKNPVVSTNNTDVCFTELEKQEKTTKQNEEITQIPVAVVAINNKVTDEAVYVNNSFSTKVHMSDFEDYFTNLTRNGNAPFREQFQDICEQSKAEMRSIEVASQPELKRKNRYKNVLPFDSSRVSIQGNESGFINACYIDGFQKKSKYIATQGPLSSTAIDFWLMVVEQQCGVIVMLAKCFEAGKKKCFKYWPDEGESLTFGDMTVSNIEEVKLSGYIRRTFRIEEDGYNDHVTVVQFQFLSWPDHGVPHTTSNLMRLHRAVTMAYKETPSTGCMIVHCSAGAGRTGTFIGLDILTEEAKRLNKVDVFNCVMNMRSQRVDMVQTNNQYILLHRLVLESHLFSDTDISSQKFQMYMTSMKSDDAKISSDFALLSQLKELDCARSKGKSQMNRAANLTDIVPFDHNILTVQPKEGEQEPQYINASWIETYDDSVAIVAAQAPMASTVEYFWKAVLEWKIQTIVKLASDKELFQYWTPQVGSTSQFGNISVFLKSENNDGAKSERCFTVSDGHEKISVIHLQYDEWKTNVCPKDTRPILELVQKLQEASRERGTTILIHCSDGAGKTGTLCAVINLIERLKIEDKVDFFRTVKDLRECRMGMVQSLDQYFFCHQVINDYLKSFELYSNFGEDSANLYADVS